MQKQRLPKVSFAIFLHRVAWGAAPWDPIVFPAKEHIGITRSYQPDQLPIWTCRVALPARALTATVLETEARRLETEPGACCTQWLHCLQDKGDHVSGANSSWLRVTVRPAGSKDNAAQPT